jgi:hypothetical protein
MQSDCAWGRSSQQAIGRGRKSETVDSVQQVVANGRFRSGSDAIGHCILGQHQLQFGGKTSLGTLLDVQLQLPPACRCTVMELVLLSREEDCTKVHLM